MKKVLITLCLLVWMATACAESRHYTQEDIHRLEKQCTIGFLWQEQPGEIAWQEAEKIAKRTMDQAGDIACEMLRVRLVQWADGSRAYVAAAFTQPQLLPYRDMKIDPVTGEVGAYNARDTHAIEQEWESLYGPMYQWTMADRALFDELYRSAKNVYCLPLPGDLKEEEALRLAGEALAERYPAAEETTDTLERCSFVRYERGSHNAFSRVWYVVWQHPQEGVLYQVMLDALTEEVLLVYDRSDPANLG